MSVEILLGEYRNQNNRRHYPFADNVTLADSDGIALPVDFLIDAFLYPIDLANGLHVSRISITSRKIYFADTVTGKEHGVATLPAVASAVYVYEPVSPFRQIGTAVFGVGLASALIGSTERIFAPGATELTPTAYIPLNQTGVRGFVLEDGSLITGNVIFEGENGVVINSQVNTLEIDIYGSSAKTLDDCGYTCGLIKEICAKRYKDSKFMISRYDASTLAITGFNMTLDDICSAQRKTSLPDNNGYLPMANIPNETPCDPPVVPPTPDPDPGDVTLPCFDVTASKSNFSIIAPKQLGGNAVAVRSVDNAGKQDAPSVNVNQEYKSIPLMETAIAKFTNPDPLGEAIAIGLKGFKRFRGSK